MSELKIFPLLWKGEQEEANPHIHQLARLFAEEELSAVPDFKTFMRTWVLTRANPQVSGHALGIMSMRMVMDVPLFHIRAPEKDRKSIVEFAEGYRMLALRGREYLQDQGWLGQQIFIHVSESSEQATMVKSLSNWLGLKESHRLAMEV